MNTRAIAVVWMLGIAACDYHPSKIREVDALLAVYSPEFKIGTRYYEIHARHNWSAGRVEDATACVQGSLARSVDGITGAEIELRSSGTKVQESDRAVAYVLYSGSSSRGSDRTLLYDRVVASLGPPTYSGCTNSRLRVEPVQSWIFPRRHVHVISAAGAAGPGNRLVIATSRDDPIQTRPCGP